MLLLANLIKAAPITDSQMLDESLQKGVYINHNLL